MAFFVLGDYSCPAKTDSRTAKHYVLTCHRIVGILARHTAGRSLAM